MREGRKVTLLRAQILLAQKSLEDLCDEETVMEDGTPSCDHDGGHCERYDAIRILASTDEVVPRLKRGTQR